MKRALLLLPILFFCCFSQDTIKLDELEKDEGLFAVVILKNNEPIFRKFYNEQTEEDLFNIYSETKSLMAILIGISIDKGYIKNIDQPIFNFFPQLLKDANPGKRQITIKHLLDQTSGLPEYEWPKTEWRNSTNSTEFLLSRPLVSFPGTQYQYNTAATHILSAIITIATKTETLKFAEVNLFKPLGITSYQWGKLNDGYYDGGGGTVFMRADDMAKIGNLLLNKGRWNNSQLVSEQWVKQLFSKENKLPAPWGLEDSLYGLCWYVAEYEGQTINYCTGYAGQYLFIIPERKTVIAVNHTHNTSDPNSQAYSFTSVYFPLIMDELNKN